MPSIEKLLLRISLEAQYSSKAEKVDYHFFRDFGDPAEMTK